MGWWRNGRNDNGDGQRPDGKSIFLGIAAAPHDGVFREEADCVRVSTHVARRLLSRGLTVKAHVERHDAPGVCVPMVPLGKTRCPLVVTTRAEVEAVYDRADDFWSAGWNIEDFGEQRLLTRCQNAVSK